MEYNYGHKLTLEHTPANGTPKLRLTVRCHELLVMDVTDTARLAGDWRKTRLVRELMDGREVTVDDWVWRLVATMSVEARDPRDRMTYTRLQVKMAGLLTVSTCQPGLPSGERPPDRPEQERGIA